MGLRLHWRRADYSDLDSVRHLYSDLTPDLEDFDHYFKTVLEDSHSWPLIVEENNRPIAFVFCHECISLSSGRSLYIDEMVVHEDRRGKGVGTEILSELAQMSIDQGIDCLELRVSLSKPELHRFYERNGFVHRGRFYSKLIRFS
ncbi:MAG: N-acetyltransferase family protein [Anaerolineae bacterium]|jgi:GNAT superfamily N-acetyltransferase